MTNIQMIIIIFLLGLSVQVTRWLPFLIFDNKTELPGIIEYMGKVLPAAMMGLLVIYCFKDYDFSKTEVLIPALAGAVSVAAVHLWKRNTVLSISVGTIIYMVLLRQTDVILNFFIR